MLNRILAILVISLIAGSGVYAAEVCNTSECLQLRDKVAAGILALQPSLQFGDIVIKDASSEKYCSSVGNTGICYMTQQKAIDYCAAQQKHLPSARELAQLASSPEFGAKGILEEKDYQQKKAAGENVHGYVSNPT